MSSLGFNIDSSHHKVGVSKSTQNWTNTHANIQEDNEKKKLHHPGGLFATWQAGNMTTSTNCFNS